MAEWEGKGLDFERYALGKLFHRFVDEYGIRTVLEVPARGEKAMPSIYSLPFGEAGCEVTLVNGQPKSKWAWEELGYPVSWEEHETLHQLDHADDSFDLVWDFMYLAQYPDREKLLDEMARVSKRYVLFIAVNRWNPGFFSHRTVHKVSGVPWTHGEVRYMNPFWVRRHFREHGLELVETGCVDCPPYPDSLGFRDMRLHRMNVDLHEIDWDSRPVWWMKEGKWPLKIKLLYLAEQLPLPWRIKLIYAHLFYVLARKPGADTEGAP
jgi:hypothetical protein